MISAENLENYLPKLRPVGVGGVGGVGGVEPATNGKAGFAGKYGKCLDILISWLY